MEKNAKDVFCCITQVSGERLEQISPNDLVFLIAELCFFMRLKLYPTNLANAHAQINKFVAYQKLLYRRTIKNLRYPEESEYKCRN